jgi:hypothetical protein
VIDFIAFFLGTDRASGSILHSLNWCYLVYRGSSKEDIGGNER